MEIDIEALCQAYADEGEEYTAIAEDTLIKAIAAYNYGLRDGMRRAAVMARQFTGTGE